MALKSSYKEAHLLEYAIKELKRNRGLQFDSQLTDKFIVLLKSGIIEVKGNQIND